MDAHDFAGGEAIGDDVEGVAVVGVVEGGDEYEVIGDVEVGVTCREALAFENYWRGHGKFDDLEGLTAWVAEGLETIEVLGQRDVVVVGGVRFDAGEDCVFGYEAGYVVDVSVGVVAGTTAVQPESLVDAEVVVEGLFKRALCRGLVAGRTGPL